MPPVAVATGPVAYVRFHGRNAAKWYNHQEAWERYNYTYSTDELQEWAPKSANSTSRPTSRWSTSTITIVGQAVRGRRDLGQFFYSQTEEVGTAGLQGEVQLLEVCGGCRARLELRSQIVGLCIGRHKLAFGTKDTG